MFDGDFRRQVLQKLDTIIGLLRGRAFSVKISEIDKKGKAGMITGTPIGGQSVFEADALLNGIADPSGFPAGSVDTWTCDDPAATLSPNSPNPGQVTVAIPATDVQGSAPAGSPPSYNLTVSVQMPAPAGGTVPAPLTATVNVPLTPAPVPLPTGVAINQDS